MSGGCLWFCDVVGEEVGISIDMLVWNTRGTGFSR